MSRTLMKSVLVSAIAALLGIVFPSEFGMAWVATAIGAAAGILSSLYGGAKASEASDEAQRELAKKEARDNAWYLRKNNQKYLDTAAGQNLIKKYEEMSKRLVKRADGGARVAGLSNNAVAKQKEQVVNAMGKTMGDIAANDTAMHERAEHMHKNDMNTITQQRMAIANQKAANITNAAAQASNALITAGSALDTSGESFWDGLTKRKKSGAPPTTTSKNTLSNIINTTITA